MYSTSSGVVIDVHGPDPIQPSLIASRYILPARARGIEKPKLNPATACHRRGTSAARETNKLSSQMHLKLPVCKVGTYSFRLWGDLMLHANLRRD